MRRRWRGDNDHPTLVCDLTEGMVEYLADERKQPSLDGYFTPLAPAQRDQIEAVAMDMWEPYIRSVQAPVPRPERKIVFDVFHLVQPMNGAVDQVRRQGASAAARSGRRAFERLQVRLVARGGEHAGASAGPLHRADPPPGQPAAEDGAGVGGQGKLAGPVALPHRREAEASGGGVRLGRAGAAGPGAEGGANGQAAPAQHADLLGTGSPTP
jgi:hypothetical protein